MSPMLLH